MNLLQGRLEFSQCSKLQVLVAETQQAIDGTLNRQFRKLFEKCIHHQRWLLAQQFVDELEILSPYQAVHQDLCIFVAGDTTPSQTNHKIG